MRRIFSSAALLSCLCVSAASWDGWCPVELTWGNWFKGGWDAALSAIYWKPDNGGFIYGGTVGGASNSINLREVKPNYHWGVRGYGRFAREGGCSYIELAGLWIRGNDAGTIGPGGTLVTPPIGMVSPVELFGKSRQEYWNIDLRLGQVLFEGKKFSWHAFGGVRYANFDFRQRIRMVQTDVEIGIDQDVRFYGVGPTVGAGGNFPIWRCFELVGTGVVTALVGERCTRLDETHTLFPTFRTRFPRATAIAPGFDLVLAGRATMRWGCVAIIGELGYELNHYWNALNVANVWNPFQTFSVRRTERDIGWAGPYFRVGVGF